MRTQQALRTAFILLLVGCTGARGQELTPDQGKRVQMGMQLVKLVCGTDLSQDRAQVAAGGRGSFTLSKLPGFTIGGQATYSKDEGHGLIATLDREITDNVMGLSKYQIDCMHPYIIRIFATIYPDAPSRSAAPESDRAIMDGLNVKDKLRGSSGAISFSVPPSGSAKGVERGIVQSASSPVVAPLQDAGPGRKASAWDGTSSGRWRTQSAPADCRSRYYSWVFTGNEVRYTDQDGERDWEKIPDISSDSMSTKTAFSNHKKGVGEALGTLWSYKFMHDGTISVSSSAGKQFTLARCPS